MGPHAQDDNPSDRRRRVWFIVITALGLIATFVLFAIVVRERLSPTRPLPSAAPQPK